MTALPSLGVEDNSHSAEDARLAVLHTYDILDTLPEQEYDDIARLASYICQTPVALISLVDSDRQWFKAKVGVEVEQTSRDVSFCAHAILQDGVLEVPDARADARFCANPLVTGDTGLRFYAGAPLLSPDGHAVGSLCVIDQAPRTLTAEQKAALQALARQVVARLELRRQAAVQRKMSAMMQAVIDGTTDAIFLKDLHGRYQMINAAGARFIGKPMDEIVGKDDTQLFPPAVAAQTQANDRQVLTSGMSSTYEDTEITDGVSRTYLSTKDVCRDAAGAATGVIGIAREITQRKKIDERLRLLEAALENANDAVVITEAEPFGLPGPRIVYVNPAFTRTTGYSAAEALGQSPRLLQGAATDPATRAVIRQSLKKWKPIRIEILNYRKDSTEFWVELNIVPIANEAGWYTHWVSVQRDVTERRRAEEAARGAALRREEELEQRVSARTQEIARLSRRNKLLLDSAGEGFFGIDLAGRNTFINPAAALMLGYTVEELLDKPMHALVHHTRPDGSPYLREECPIYAAFTDGLVHHESDEVFWHKDGTSFPVDYVSTPVREEGRLIGAVVTFRDISLLKALQNKQAKLLAEALERAERDSLTGLWNHRGFQSRLEAEADRVQRTGGRLALAVMDVDNFKFFNDVYGHAVGDDVLRQVAGALRGCCRSYDTLARYGGDEFVLLAEISETEDAAGLAERLRTALSGLGYRPPGYNTTIPVGASVGLAVFPSEAATRLDLVELADRRLRHVKAGEGTREALVESLRAKFAGTLAGFPMLSALVNAVDIKDRYTRRHSEDVLVYSLQIAEALGLDEETQQNVAVAALLHDVGKIGVPDDILRKPGHLTDAEFEAIQQHPDMGANIVGAVPGFEEALGAVRHHHERWDGGGYPGSLRGAAIPLLARLMAVADAYSAMTTDRPYRKGMEDSRALSILEEGAGTQWDPVCVHAFLRARQQVTAAGLPDQNLRP